MTASLTATKAWQSVTLTQDEIWGIQGVKVQIDTEADEAVRCGLQVRSGETIQFRSGLTLYYRKFDDAPAVINRIGV